MNTEFSKEDIRIIFWFDDKGEYEDEVSELQLDNAKLHILDGANWFYSKWLLNESDTESKYLVYAPFPKPSDAENPLADMCFYSALYYTDRISQMSQEMGIDNRFKEYLAQYSNFWKDRIRIEKFKELSIDHFNVETIDIGLIAVLTNVETPNFEEIIRQLLLNNSEAYMKALEDNGLLEKFWELCERYFGYQSESPNMDDLAACMLLTYASVALKDTLPAVLKSYVLKKKNDVVVFVRNLMDNVLYQEVYDALSEKVDKTLRVVSRIRDELKKDIDKSKDHSAQLLDIVNCDAFLGVDDILIDWALEQLNNEILDAQIDDMNIAQIADQRTAKTCHFYLSRLSVEQNNTINIQILVSSDAGTVYRDHGIRFYINCREGTKHNEPHIHVDIRYGEATGAFSLKTGQQLTGDKIGRKDKKIIEETISLHQSEFLQYWNEHTDGLDVDLNQVLGLIKY